MLGRSMWIDAVSRVNSGDDVRGQLRQASRQCAALVPDKGTVPAT